MNYAYGRYEYSVQFDLYTIGDKAKDNDKDIDKLVAQFVSDLASTYHIAHIRFEKELQKDDDKR